MSQRLKTDWILFPTVLIMVSLGLLVIYSASSVTAEMDLQSRWFFVIRQSAWALASVAVMMTLKKTHYKRLNSAAVAFSAIGITFILLVLVFILDAKSHRWLKAGSLSLQPSELAKPALVVFLAYFVTWRGRAINNWKYTLLPAAVLVGLVIVGVVIPDLGTAVVLGIAAGVIFFVAGLEKRYCAVVAGIALLGVIASIAVRPYRLARVVQWVDPQYKRLDRLDPSGKIKATLQSSMQNSLATRDTGYQSEQSKIAVGAGGATGLGIMNGKQKLYLPASHTDFIYAVVAEEMGLIGAAGLLLGFGVIFWRGLRAAWRMHDDFGRYLALGVTIVIVVQGLINMSVVLGMMPTKGLPLPMISYGGSSLLSTLALMGILMNVSEHAG
ncbi:MAG TPA: putative peptidoglycan glycosyltransferase FtsW [Bryobacteraceae bacterium]|nr:putative peptidoglycan glycosyltransferase FtsW [Bryobacteraceae bacterium]